MCIKLFLFVVSAYVEGFDNVTVTNAVLEVLLRILNRFFFGWFA